MKLVDGAKLWALHATHGLPLELSLPLLADDGYVPTWDTLLAAAAADGANLSRLRRRLAEIARDAYPAGIGPEIAARLEVLECAA